MDSNEIWKPVIGYEGCYEVSNFGRVRSLDRFVPHNGRTKFAKGEVLLPNLIQRGYLQVCLYKNGVGKRRLIHRLVMEAFNPTDDDSLVINHKDLDKTNNIVSNLEWVTHKQNTRHAWDNGACDETLKKRSKKVINLLTGDVYPSEVAASRAEKIPKTTLWRLCKKGERFAWL